jgi:hypothetical protein
VREPQQKKTRGLTKNTRKNIPFFKTIFWTRLKFFLIASSIVSCFAIATWLITKKNQPINQQPNAQPSIAVSSSTPPSPIPFISPIPTTKPTKNVDLPTYIANKGTNSDLVYQFVPTEFQNSERLQTIVDRILVLVKEQKLPIEPLSITLIDLKNAEIAGYQQNTLRLPASVVKLFWMVNLYGQFAAQMWKEPNIFSKDLQKAIKNSDNEAASRIVDAITQTKSGEKLSGEAYQNWLIKRQSMNLFFANAGYTGINISQKTFPIPSEKMNEPEGRDLQLRGDLKNPIRNKISTYQAARLMYEIFSNKAISPSYSQNLQAWLTWDLEDSSWQNIDPNLGRFNPILTFFGEGLPQETIFASKAGWTSNTRQEVAYIGTKDGRVSLVLSVFAEDASYSKDKKIFPAIAKLVYDSSTKLNDRGRAMINSAASKLTGLVKRYPCPSSQPNFFNSASCSEVSIPSAIALIPKE